MQDGIDHINVYSKGKTELGRCLSNFHKSPFICDDGEFMSIEGYWYWLSCERDELRELWGYDAKRVGRKLRGRDWVETEEFKEKIEKAIYCKLDFNWNIKEKLIESNLPFDHYYMFGDRVVKPEKGRWILDILEQVRVKYKHEQTKLS